MREIKFRAWDKKEKWYIDDMFLRLDGNLYDDAFPTYDTPNKEIERVDLERFILEQYTGLEDRNEKEIFEGDILRGAMRNLIVAYKGAGFIAYWNDHDYGYGTEQMWCNLVEGGEVIGNIHENPELLVR